MKWLALAASSPLSAIGLALLPGQALAQGAICGGAQATPCYVVQAPPAPYILQGPNGQVSFPYAKDNIAIPAGQTVTVIPAAPRYNWEVCNWGPSAVMVSDGPFPASTVRGVYIPPPGQANYPCHTALFSGGYPVTVAAWLSTVAASVVQVRAW